jgi:precorrin-2 dehydrogenase/sirohydrochlorin ferrochelatase
MFENDLPDEIDDLAHDLNDYRKTLKNDFEYKVKKMNEVTRGLVEKVVSN